MTSVGLDNARSDEGLHESMIRSMRANAVKAGAPAEAITVTWADQMVPTTLPDGTEVPLMRSYTATWEARSA
jgi:hypothetical protein